MFLHLMREQGATSVDRLSAPNAASGLTPRQREVLALLAEGVPAKAIAARLELAEVTVRNHIRAILRALGAHSQLEALAAARRRELV